MGEGRRFQGRMGGQWRKMYSSIKTINFKKGKPLEGVFQFRYNSYLLSCVSEVCGIFSNSNLPLSSDGQPRASAVIYIVLGVT